MNFPNVLKVKFKLKENELSQTTSTNEKRENTPN